MGMSNDADDATDAPVTFEMEIDEEKTEIVVSGDRDTAVIVRSESGEQVYLPPEDFDREPKRQTPYQSSYGSQAQSQTTPYQSQADTSSIEGMESTADGYIIVHPEPVTDIRFLR